MKIQHLRRRSLLLAMLALTACATRKPMMPVPQLPPAIALRVRYLYNPRLPEPPAGFQEAVLARARPMARDYLGLDLEFIATGTLDISQAFSAIDARKRARLVAGLYDFRRGGDRDRLVRSTRKVLEEDGSSLDSLLRYAQPHLASPVTGPGFQALAEAVVHTQLTRIQAWSRLAGTDGKPLFDDSLQNEYTGWMEAAASGGWDFEVALTNQLIAGVEYEDNHLHSALRGGVTNGIATQAPATRYGVVSILSLFPFTSNDEATVALRGGVRAEGDEPAAWAAALLVHELGHQLLHLNHPYARTACVMNPPPLLRFREWLAELDGKACPIGSSAEMKPGAVKFEEIRQGR